MTDLSRINLNLIVALDALITEKHVTRAGERIHISQSAMSAILAQLRLLFNDPLLVRDGKAMTITPKAAALQPKIKQVLQQINQLVAPTEFNPKTSTRTFYIGMSDYAEFIVLPKLLPLLSIEAPGIRLKIKHLNGLDRKEPFIEKQLDLGIGVTFDKKSEALDSEALFIDRTACLADKDHPLMQRPLQLDEYLQAQHMVVVFPEAPFQSRIDTRLKQLGHQRNAIITLSHMLPALHALKNTPYLLTTTTLIA
ncbi:LysR family transcriptional regulator, partial [Piscirickettsia litoralis]